MPYYKVVKSEKVVGIYREKRLEEREIKNIFGEDCEIKEIGKDEAIGSLIWNLSEGVVGLMENDSRLCSSFQDSKNYYLLIEKEE